MTKVKREIIEAAVVKLMANITATMPTMTYKFMFGGATALASLNNGAKIHEMLGLVADQDGFIDFDAMKAILDGGFAATEGKVTIDLFNKPTGLMSLLVKPLTLTITKQDIDGLLAEIEQNAVHDVALSSTTEMKTDSEPTKPTPTK